MKKILMISILFILSNCTALTYATKIEIKQIKNDDFTNELLNDNYHISLGSDAPIGFTFMMFGIIIPILPILGYTKCNGKTYINMWIFDKTSNSIENVNRNIKLKAIFDDMKILEYNVNMEVMINDYSKKNYLFGRAELPISCNAWKRAKVQIEDIYLNKMKQKVLEFEVKKISKWEFQ